MPASPKQQKKKKRKKIQIKFYTTVDIRAICSVVECSVDIVEIDQLVTVVGLFSLGELLFYLNVEY